MSGVQPVLVATAPTDEAGVIGVDHALPPGSTRLVVRYLLHEEDNSLEWSSRALYDTEERVAMVNPPDVDLEAEGMISTESRIEGYAAYAGLAEKAGATWKITLQGGSSVTAADTGQATQMGEFTDIVARPNRLTNSRTPLLIGLGAALLLVVIFALRTGARSAPDPAALDEKRLAVSKLADRYVSGEITREEYEKQAAGMTRKSRRKPAHVG
jgi:hypothetical protein